MENLYLHIYIHYIIIVLDNQHYKSFPFVQLVDYNIFLLN